MVAATVIPLNPASQQLFMTYYSMLQNSQNSIRDSQRARFAEVDREYQREKNRTDEHLMAKQANKLGDSTRFRDMTVPIVMPQVESAVTYQASVFLTGVPLFGVVASPAYMDEAVQMESLIDENATRGGWIRELILSFRDGAKYNFAPMEICWKDETTAVLETDITKSVTQGTPREVIWSGNSLRRLDPYNTFVDPRVPPTEVYKSGEYAGYTEIMSKIALKSFVASLPDKQLANVRPAFESPRGAVGTLGALDAKGYYIPSINPEVTADDYYATGINWDAWAGISTKKDNNSIQYKDIYEVTTLFCKILPSEFGLKVPSANTPQIFKLVIVNHSVILYAERQTNAHNYLPILIGQPLEDGLRDQTKSLAQNGAEFQNLATAYMSSIIASRRRAVTDRVLYDPSRIAAAHINSPNPSAKIPVRPAAYGKNISDAVYQFPYREDQAAASMQQVQSIIGLSNTVAGQNLAGQGQFVKGNKTLHEFESTMRNANGRDQLAAILFEHQVLIPLKHILKLNILQYQGGTSIYNRDVRKVVEVDPVALRKAVMEFKISDGLVPSSKLLNTDAFSTAVQVIGSSQQIAGSYNLGPMFSYIMKSQGADLTPFEKTPQQVAYEQALQQWQQIATMAIDKGIDPNASLPPMPLPAQYGFNPQNVKPAPPEAQAPADNSNSGVIPQ